MTDTAKVLHEIAKLYAKPKKDQPLSDAVLELEEALSSRFDEYEKAFQGMYTANLIKAVDDFWRFKSDKVRPTLAQILAMHESDTSKKSNTEEENQNMRARILKCADELGDKYGKKARDTYLKIARQQWPNVDLSGHEWTAPVTPSADANAAGGYAEEYMQRDIKLNRCRHLLPVYQQAVRYIAEDLLAQEIPAYEWHNMDFAERCAAAMRKGLFNRFDDVLVDVCRRWYGKDYQFDCPKPVNVAQAGYLPAHWTDMDKFELSEVC